MQKAKLPGFFLKITMIPHHVLTLARHLSACQIMFGAVLAVYGPLRWTDVEGRSTKGIE
jgi:hypothetical protein